MTVDSTGLPNGSGTCPARADAREGRAGVEARLAVVAQRGTATRPWWELLPGSASDATGLGRIIARCEGVGVRAGPCPTGAGHRADASLDEPCDDGRRCPAPYVTRPRPNPPWHGEAVPRAPGGIESRESLARYGDRHLLAGRVPVMVGRGHDQPAWPRVGQAPRACPDGLRELLAGAGRKRPGAGRACEGLESQGVFALLSGTPHEAGDILPERCVRQGIEQPDDVARGHARLLPTRCHTVETLAGHVLLSTMGSSVMRLARIRPDDGEAYLASRTGALRSQGCIPYEGRLVPDEPTRPANEACRLFGAGVPTPVPIRGGSLAVDPPRVTPRLLGPPKRRVRKRRGRLADTGAAAKP